MHWIEKSGVNTYAFKARVLPVLYVIAPLIGSSLFLFPRLLSASETAAGGVICVLAYYFIAERGRDRGKAMERQLFSNWCGMPSVAMLRHRDSRVNGHAKERWRTYLQSEVPDLVLATAVEEAQCPEWADEKYESATMWLLRQTGDPTRFRTLQAENASYGFRRNLLGLKWWAPVVDVVSLSALAVWHRMTYGDAWGTTSPEVWLCVLLILGHCGFFLWVVRPAWVKVVADAYGRELLTCIFKLVQPAM